MRLILAWTFQKGRGLHITHKNIFLACEQAVRGALAAGREKEGELATESLEFDYLHRKSRWESWSAEMTLVIIFHVFFNVCLHSCSFPLRADRLKSDRTVDGEPQGNWWRNSNFRNVLASSPSFSRPAARAPRRACPQALFFLDI